MYNLQRNNYHQNPKNSSIQTPTAVSEFLFDLLNNLFDKRDIILDIGSGRGALSKPWKKAGFEYVWGIEKDEKYPATWQTDFLALSDWAEINKLPGPYVKRWPSLILCNPPFNGMKPKLAPEVWLDKIIELFGKKVPIVFFTPVGFRLNLTPESERFRKFDNGTYPEINSFISLPKNIFPNVVFHSEILIFNIHGLEPHYFY